MIVTQLVTQLLYLDGCTSLELLTLKRQFWDLGHVIE